MNVCSLWSRHDNIFNPSLTTEARDNTKKSCKMLYVYVFFYEEIMVHSQLSNF